MVIAKKEGFGTGETTYESTRRENPRIGGKTKADLRILLSIDERIILEFGKIPQK